MVNDKEKKKTKQIKNFTEEDLGKVQKATVNSLKDFNEKVVSIMSASGVSTKTFNQAIKDAVTKWLTNSITWREFLKPGKLYQRVSNSSSRGQLFMFLNWGKDIHGKENVAIFLLKR